MTISCLFKDFVVSALWCRLIEEVLNTNYKIVVKGKIDTLNTQIHDNSLSLFGTGTSINSCGVKLVLWALIFPLSEMMLPYKCLPQLSYRIRIATKLICILLRPRTSSEYD
jgi:hypothetical protein